MAGGYLLSLLVFIFPGYVLLSFLWKNNSFSFWEKVGLSPAVSLPVYPLLHLWFYFFNISPGKYLAWGVVCASVFLFLWIKRHKLFSLNLWKEALDSLSRWRPGKKTFFSFLLVVVVGCLVASRFYVIKSMTGPAWGDAVNHVFIVQLFRDNGGLFQSWAPYAPIESLTYHFGFHSGVAVWAELAGIPSAQAVLLAGQVFNVLAVLALYPLVLRVAGNKWAALGGLIFAGLLFPMPGFFVNWSRFTQLAAQVILPVVVLFLFILVQERGQLPMGFWILLGVLFIGLALTHYRVAFLGATAFLAWFLWSLWEKRKSFSLWFERWVQAGLVVGASFVLILPWIVHVWQSRMFELSGIKENASLKAFYDPHPQVWKHTEQYFSDFFWIGGLLILAFLFWRRAKLAFPVLGWAVASLVLANPGWMGLPGEGVVPNEILVFALYIPLALLFGWFSGAVWVWFLKRRRGIGVVVFSAAILVCFGMSQQLQVVDPFFQMLYPEDLEAFEWINKNVPEDAFFLVNGFVMQDWNSVAGSDAGWWLPLYTQRENTVPPQIYALHKLKPGIKREMYPQIVNQVRQSEGRRLDLREVLCDYGITHVFLGSKRGEAAYEPDSRLIPESWLKDNQDFQLVFEQGKAQVWAFDR